MVYLLHISDLHLVTNPLWSNMKKAILSFVHEKLQNIPVGEKLLVITGDLHNFIENNYDQAMEFLPELFKEMGIEADKDVFVIPGNHDIINDIPSGVDREIIIQAVQSKPELLHHDRVDKLLLCYDHYVELVKSLNIYKSDCEKLPVQVHVRTWRDKLHLLHLNTSLVSEGGERKKQLVDVHTATSDEIRKELEVDSLPCIAMGHHSFFDLSDKQQEILSGMFQQENISVYLCGDRHQRNKKREENRIPLSPEISSISIPHIVSYRTSTDEKDQYSDFGMILHIWDEKTGHVEMELMKWDINYQSDLQPDGKDAYDFRSNLHKKQVLKQIQVKSGEKRGWFSGEDLKDKCSIPIKPAQIREFLLGGYCGWNLAFSDDCIVERNIVDTLYQCALDGGVYALAGPGGEGKSTALMQLCKKLVRSDKSVFYYRGRRKIELPVDIMEDSILIVDNPPDSIVFKRFLEDVIDNGYTLILGVRENEWNLLKKSLGISNREVRDISMPKLTAKESWIFADCVCNNLRHSKDRKEIKDIFFARSYGFLYAAMLLAVSNKNSLEEIAHQIIENLANKYRKALLLLAYIVFSEQYNIRFDRNQFKVVCGKLGMSRHDGNYSLSREISLNGEMYQTRHEVISKLFFSELFSESGLLETDEIDGILTNLINIHLNYYRETYGNMHKEVKSIMKLLGGLSYASLDTQKYLFNRLFDEVKFEFSENFKRLLLYIRDKETQLIFYRVCFDRGRLSSVFLWNWCRLLMQRGTPWTLYEPYAPSWIMREACLNREAGPLVWRRWILLEMQYGSVGDYNSENTARWICRKACIQQKANNILWQTWGKVEESQGNIGDYCKENSARWIYRKACVEQGVKGAVWQAWIQLEEKQGNIGNYNEENCVRWIYREACINHNVGDSSWQTWGELEEKQGNIGDYNIENSARWIYRKAYMEQKAINYVLKAWGELETRQGNIGDYGKENSARWIYRKACMERNANASVWKAWGELEESQGNAGDYDKENSARWIYRKACVEKNMKDDIWKAWGELEESQGNVGDYDKENSARWIYHKAYCRYKVGRSVWKAWGELEESQGNVGDYDKENSVRWIYRKACMERNANASVWKAWGELEESQGNIGDYEKENSARWIYHEAYRRRRADKKVWIAWGRLEESQGNIGDYDKENSARWIYHKFCLNHKTDKDVWLAWGRLEERQGNIGDYDKENSARWIHRKMCIHHNVNAAVWLIWGRLEERLGNIGDYDNENSARWIYVEGIRQFPDFVQLYYELANLEMSQCCAGKARVIMQKSLLYSEFFIVKLAIIEFFYGNIDSEDEFCVKKLLIRAESHQTHSLREMIYLYYCYSLLGQTEEAENYHNLFVQYPNYDFLYTQVQSFVQQCQKAVTTELSKVG